METQIKKQRKTWESDDEELLVEVWADKLGELRGQRKNSHVYKEMAKIMGDKYTPEEIKIKIHNLSNRYRREKKQVGPSGGSPSQWGLYYKIHQLLGGLRINNLDEVIEDSIMEPLCPPPSLVDPSVPSSEPPTASSRAGSPIASSSTCSTAVNKRKRVTRGMEEIKKADDIISANFKIMHENDARMIEVEEKRNEILERIANSCALVQEEILNLLQKK